MSSPATYQKLVAVRAADTLRDSIEIQESPLPEPGPDEILVKTHYAGVNAADYLMAVGRYLARTTYPATLGAEATGEVVAVGANVNTVNVGDSIMAMSGGYTEYFTMPARRAIPVPEARPEVVALGISGLTASIALEDTGEMTSGETVLVTAAAGGTGSFVVQLAKLAGNTVIGTCSTDEKAAYLRDLGCDRPVNYRTESLKDVLKSEFPDGVDIVFESVGGEMYDTALNALAVRGRLIVIGAISEYKSGPQTVTRIRDSYLVLSKSASIRGFWLMHYFRQAIPHMQKLLGLMNEGKLQAAVDPTEFNGVSGAIDAIDYLYAGKNQGKVVVRFV